MKLIILAVLLGGCECRFSLDTRRQVRQRVSTPPESLYEPRPYNLMEDMAKPANPLSPLSPINPASPLYSPTPTWQP